jgi:hypothetical protein
MYGTDTGLLKSCLWGLSNLTTEPHFADLYFQNEQCVERTLILIGSPNKVLNIEACWVLFNALSTTSLETTRYQWQTKSQDLVTAIVTALRIVEKTNYLL